MPDAKEQEVLPDKGEGPVGQLKKNLGVYAQVYAECMKQAAKIVDDSIEGLDKPLTDTEFLDRQQDIATVMFEQFWSDQIAIKSSKNQGAMSDVLKNFLDEQQGRGAGAGMGYPLAGGFR
jgi:hypothetical protein